MIVVVEGPSGAGKTTWVTAQAVGQIVPEADGTDLPDGLGKAELAEFWNEVNCRRWSEAVRGETAVGLALCDTDPLKLHYDYCLARIGEAPWERFDIDIEVTASSIADRRLGIADLVLVSIPDDDSLQRRRDLDSSRRRRNFELHRRLGAGLREWYATLDRLDPGRVGWGYPSGVPRTTVRERFDTDLFRTWMEQLPREADTL